MGRQAGGAREGGRSQPPYRRREAEGSCPVLRDHEGIGEGGDGVPLGRRAHLQPPALSVALRSRIEADFCASSVHVAEQSGDMEALDHVIMLRRIHLEDIKSDRDTSRAVQARMDLGRALLARATKQFDRKTVEEAISHLSKVIEALQADPTIKRAQAASDAMYKAQNLLETRKRFAVNFGG